jgi:ABC-type multidrug transport system fused ATPase/permease subunit
MTRIESLNLTKQATDALIARGVPAQIAAAASLVASPIREQTTSLVRRVVGEVVSSELFATAWSEANRVVHTQRIRLLEGDTSALAQNASGQLVLNLSAISGPLRTALVDAGVPGADKIPDIDAQVVVGDGTRIAKAQGVYQLIKDIPVALLILTIVLLALGVFFSQQRLRAVLFMLAGIVAAVLITLAAVRAGRDFALGNLRQDVRAAAQAMITIVSDRLRTTLRVVGWIALVALAVALVSGTGPRATALRSQVRHTSEVAWAATMAWQHTYAVSLVVTVVAVVVLFVTDLPPVPSLLLVVVAVLAGITAWFGHRPAGNVAEPGASSDRRSDSGRPSPGHGAPGSAGTSIS